MSVNSKAVVMRKMIFIIEELLRHPYQTREEISEKWLKNYHSDGIAISRRTFLTLRDEIAGFFDVLIEPVPDGRDRVYYIQNPEDLDHSKVFQWVLSSIRLGDLLLNARSLHSRILLEEFPSENGRMLPILDAMRKNVRLSVEYRRYGFAESKTHVIAPYCIKQYKRCLYLVGEDTKGHIIPLAFDRMLDIELTDESFVLPYDFDAETYFVNAFGIFVDNENYPPQKVILRATPNESCYMNDIPIHQSQSIIAETTDYTDYSYFLSVTDDLIGYILSRADRLMVISPESLAEEVRKRHFQSSRLYRAVKDKS